jgi:DNA repair exonuclease SbcCD ATPase subunit
MINNSYKIQLQDISSISAPSAISYMSRGYSPTTPKSVNQPHKLKNYKSPQSTPTTSPIPLKFLSAEEISQCLSKKNNEKPKETISMLRQQLKIQLKKIDSLEEENRRLTQIKISGNWEKELIKRTDEIRKLENQLKYYKELAAESSDYDKLLDTIVEKDNKIQKLESENSDFKQLVQEQEKVINKLKTETKNLKETEENHSKCLKREEYEELMIQIQELEINLEAQARENKNLKEKFNSELQNGSLIYFSQDISKIKKEMNKLSRVLQDIQQGKELSLKSLLGLDNDWKPNPVQKLSSDIQSIKNDLNTVLAIISDFHAENCGNIICRNQ